MQKTKNYKVPPCLELTFQRGKPNMIPVLKKNQAKGDDGGDLWYFIDRSAGEGSSR